MRVRKISNIRSIIILLLSILYISISTIADFFHNHPGEMKGLFHEDCPACLWNDQNNASDNLNIQNPILACILIVFNSGYFIFIENTGIHYQIVKGTYQGRSPPES